MADPESSEPRSLMTFQIVQSEHPPWYRDADNWVAIGTGALVVVTALLAIFTLKLWRSTRDLVDDAKETSKRELRAYVSVKPVLPIRIPFLFEWHTTGMRFIVQNDGKTPAYDVQQVTHIAIGRNDLQARLRPVEFGDDGSRSVLNPGVHTEIVIKSNDEIEEAHRPGFLARELAIIVWGEVQYRDTFDIPRSTKFAFRITGQGDQPGNFHHCRFGNEST